ncbi:hypothetical protein K7X08_013088 [Anisodus acutangulus]|uniref:Homeobox-leucine zipper protein n=1 Tax=Anisodus acutangulus TaxID=402998 RepID=A0A9Q1RH16_9SOLA|nr:hypothetical protein K7X08_013088 [Anisodus acutangulus]
MKRFSFSDSSGKLLYPTEEKNTENLAYNNEFQAMLDGLEDEDGIEESGGCGTGKKRRLRVDQVQALEKIFEVDNKLDADRKVKIAQELGLQPRQIAIWFQNRRARWKTKQLERDYNSLKANYEALQHNYTKVEEEKAGLITELKGLKEKLGEETLSPAFQRPEEILELNPRNNLNSDFVDSKDGSSDSDSSGVMNEENYNNLNYQPLMPKVSSYNASLDHLSLSSSTYTQLLDPRASSTSSMTMRAYNNQQQAHVGRMEVQNGFTTEDSCNIYSVDQAPNLYWYFSDHRN